MHRGVTSSSLASGIGSTNTLREPGICLPSCWKKMRQMKAKHGKTRQKSRTQTSCSADEHVMYVTWQLGHGVHPQADTQDFCSCAGRTRGPTSSSQFSCVTKKTRVLVPLVSILAQHSIFRGPSMSIIPKHVQHKGTAPEQVPTQPRKEH